MRTPTDLSARVCAYGLKERGQASAMIWDTLLRVLEMSWLTPADPGTGQFSTQMLLSKVGTFAELSKNN